MGQTPPDPPGFEELSPAVQVDWSMLQELGEAPLLRLETAYGPITIQLDTEQAPLAVQQVATTTRAGKYDGVSFDRVIPAFASESGDVTGQGGYGPPDAFVRSEMTQIHFAAAVIGMSNDGPDTEGTRFFITQTLQPQLDGRYTAFGWIVGGAEVLAKISTGDTIIRATVTPSTARGDA
jgi:peptidyl-prolyl cis-trans isomerase B (cyclophilin B)